MDECRQWPKLFMLCFAAAAAAVAAVVAVAAAAADIRRHQCRVAEMIYANVAICRTAICFIKPRGSPALRPASFRPFRCRPILLANIAAIAVVAPR